MCVIFGLIPARGGSKGIQRKNIIDVGGKPLISYVIESGMAVSELDGLFVSTEDDEISSVAKTYGAEVIERPDYIAGDKTPVLPVIQHAIERIESADKIVDWIMLLQPTYPFILPKRIKEVATMCRVTKADSVTTLVESDFRFHPFNARGINKDGTASFLFPGEKARMPNRQSATKAFYFGNIVATRKETVERGSIYGDTTACVPIEHWEGMDIDSPYDLMLCRLLIRHWGGLSRPEPKN